MLRGGVLVRSTGAAVVLWVAAASFAQQEPPAVPVFPSAVELVTVDAVVLDDRGRPVRGLKREDFTLTEDGRPQEIASFEAVDAGEIEPPDAARRALEPVATNERRGRAAGRAFVVLVDDAGLAPENVLPLTRALSRLFEEGFGDADEVTLATTSGSVWWSVRIPEGREDLVSLLGRVKAGKLADSAAELMSDWEAYQIKNYEGFSDTSPGTARSAAPPGIVVPGTDLVSRVVNRWLGMGICDPRNRGECEGRVRMRANEKDARRSDRTRAIVAGVERSVFSLTGIHGRKELFLFSEGFLNDQSLGVVREVAGICREANVVVNFVDARGLVGAIEEMTAAFAGEAPDPREGTLVQMERSQFESEGSVGLAEDTGGLAITNNNDLAGAAQRVLDESRAYYLLGYHPPPGKGPRDWRKVKVEVRRESLRVRARKGYTLRAATADAVSVVAAADKSKSEKKDKKEKKDKTKGEAAGAPVEVSRALLNAHDVEGIPVRALGYAFGPRTPGKTQVLVAVEADMSRLLPRPGEPPAALSLFLSAANPNEGAVASAEQRYALSGGAPGTTGWSLFTRDLDLAPGPTQIRVVARDARTGRIGAVTARLEVPPAAGLRFTTPILTDRLAPSAAPGERPRPVAVAHRGFSAPGPLYCQYQVLGAGKDRADGTPKVEGAYLLRRADGEVVRRGTPSVIAAAPDGPIVRMMQLSLEGMAAGDYELVLRVVDLTNGYAVERAEAFRVEAGGALAGKEETR
jgi:VWFA-related protein